MASPERRKLDMIDRLITELFLTVRLALRNWPTTMRLVVLIATMASAWWAVR